VLTLYSAEWCPFSSAVREVLTELGIDYIARQVEPWPEERETLRGLAGSDRIPVLLTDDGELFVGTRQIFGYLREQEPWEHATAHRSRFADHRDARESDAPGQLVEFFRATDELDRAEGSPTDAEIVDVPEESRYELRLGGRRIGLAAYRRRNGRIAFTHTEVDEDREGHGFGSRLARAALEDAGRKGLEVVPLCPFMAHYIDRHPEYQALVAPGYGDR
jgi:predicted GNAT family acetyltransferase/glutaredoxin